MTTAGYKKLNTSSNCRVWLPAWLPRNSTSPSDNENFLGHFVDTSHVKISIKATTPFIRPHRADRRDTKWGDYCSSHYAVITYSYNCLPSDLEYSSKIKLPLSIMYKHKIKCLPFLPHIYFSLKKLWKPITTTYLLKPHTS